MTQHKPFADDAASYDCAGLTVENGSNSIALYGQTTLTRDKAGLARAQALLRFAQDVVQALTQDAGSLPEAVAPPKTPGKAANPFS